MGKEKRQFRGRRRKGETVAGKAGRKKRQEKKGGKERRTRLIKSLVQAEEEPAEARSGLKGEKAAKGQTGEEVYTASIMTKPSSQNPKA